MTGGTSCHHLNGDEQEEELGFGDNNWSMSIWMLNVDLSFCLHCLHTALVAQLVNTRELCCFVKCVILSDYLFFVWWCPFGTCCTGTPRKHTEVAHLSETDDVCHLLFCRFVVLSDTLSLVAQALLVSSGTLFYVFNNLSFCFMLSLVAQAHRHTEVAHVRRIAVDTGMDFTR